jgi:predicted  nucleic acid-binding Zn-ribbon protein
VSHHVDSLSVSVDRDRLTVSTADDTLTGRVVDLRGRTPSPSPTALADRLPRGGDWRDRPEFDADRSFATVTPDPPPARRLAAVAARSRGVTTPVDDALAAAATADDPVTDAAEPPDLATARERVVTTGNAVERLRERVSTLRGRLQAAREIDGDPADVQSELDTAMRALTEAETDELAAKQRLTRARKRARAHRDVHERRLRRHDARRNRAREARTHLAAAVADRLATVTERVADTTDRGQATFDSDTGTVTGDSVTFHLAALVAAETAEPVVVGVDDLGDLAALAELLAVPVIACRPPA